jgi:ATP-dependent DNA helicase DinG
LAKEAPEDLRAVGRRAGEIRDDLRFLLQANDRDYVYYLEQRGRGVFLRASPVNVASLVRNLLLDRFSAVVLTSATLAVEGSFAYVRSRLGIERCEQLQLASEFDFASQALLYLPKRMPSPKTAAFAQAAGLEILGILRRTKGRAFVLFTSYAVLRVVHATLEDALEYPLLVQGSAPRSTLLAQFRSTPHAVLLATSSFWQGVDVVGEALSCVIIDRLPFASPGDPVVAARIEAIAARGGDGFGDFQVPLAILTLLQGLGRLIRHRRDRGVLAILDPRIRTMPYGRRFLVSLPPAPVTSDPDDIDRFFAVDSPAR